MSTWKQLVSAALVGTSQAKTPPPPAALEPILSATGQAGQEVAFLSTAGTLSLWRRAGYKPESSPAAFPPAAPEERPAISPHSANHLRRMLRGDFLPFLPRWLEAVDRAGQRLPFEQLPALLDLALQNRDLRPLVTAVAGHRGAWLASLKSEWNFAAAETEDLWETGTRDQRVKWLATLRRTDPAVACTRIQSTWKSDPADARAAFLAVLETGLSMEDEPFLEQVLDDRGKEVRRVAVNLLARLPASRFVARMIARATPLLTLKAGKRLALVVTLPAGADPAATRDGLDPKAFADEKKFGEKASLLLQILAAVPPAHWTRTFNATPDLLLAAAKKEDFARAIISGWANATVRFGDAAWAEALLAGPLPMENWIGVGPSFLNVLPLERRAAYLAERVRSEGLFEGKRAVWNELVPTLLAFDTLWPDRLATAVATALTRVATKGIFYYLRAEAQQLLLHLPPDLAARTTAAWPTDQEGLTDLADLTTFRHEALQALSTQ